jgi:hypothetical protein
LSQIFRAKICVALNHAGLLDQLPRDIWTKPWVAHCQHAGRGQKVLDYLGRYIFQVAIANSRLERIQDGQVTFRYRDNRSQQLRRVTLSGLEFLHRASAPHADATSGRRRSSADTLSSVSNGDLDPGGRSRSATDAGAMTVSSPDVARTFARARRVAATPSASPTGSRVSGACDPSVAFIQRTPAIFDRHLPIIARLTPLRLPTRRRSLKLQ